MSVSWLWHNWFLMALLVPLLWSLITMVDAVFIGAGVYKNPEQGTIISTLFGAIPWLAVPFGWVSITLPSWPLLILCVAGGVFYGAHVFFYFKALFHTNDVVVAESFANLHMIIVPILALVFLSEQLKSVQYAGIALAFVGTLALIQKRKKRKSVQRNCLSCLCASVFMVSVSMVSQDYVYQHVDFWSGALLFSLGVCLFGCVIWGVKRTKGVVLTAKRHATLFLLVEGVGLGAILASQRAIELSPAVSLVSALESIGPVFTLVLSLLFLWALQLVRRTKGWVGDVFRQQVNPIGQKMVATGIIISGIFLVTGA